MNRNQKKIYGLLFAFLIMFLFLMLPKTVRAAAAYEVLAGSDSLGPVIQQIWRSFIQIINSLVVILLILVAFSEILRININTYGIKKILPTLILAIVAANFSFLLVRLIVDIANIASTFINNIGGTGENITVALPKFKWGITNASGIVSNSIFDNFFPSLVSLIGLLIEIIIYLILTVIFIVRNWMIYLLAIVSPAAIMAIVLPQTKQYFNTWWSNLIKWTFMPIVSYFFLAINNAFADKIIHTSSFPVMGSLFSAGCFYLAITTPFKLGGAALQPLSKLGNWAKNKAQKKWVDPWIQQRKDRFLRWYQESGSYDASVKGQRLRGIVGGFARRASQTDTIREADKRAVELSRDQLKREAFGGKYGKGGIGATGDQFMSKADQEKWGKYFDDIESMGGEWDWKKKDLELRYKETDKGREAAARSLQYKLRVEDTNNRLETIDNVVKQWAFAEGKGSNPYHSNSHFHEIWEKVMASRTGKEITGMSAKKYEEDALKVAMNNALALNQSTEAYHEWKKKKKELEEAKLKYDPSKDTDGKQKEALEEAIKEADEELAKAKKSFDDQITQHVKNFFDPKTGKMVGLGGVLGQMLCDNDGKFAGKIELGPDGKPTGGSFDIENATALYEVYGLTDNERDKKAIWMFNDRATKKLSLSVKEELSSVAGKRTAEDSWQELLYNKNSSVFLQKILSGDLTGMTETQFRKGYAEFANVIQGASNPLDANFAKIQQDLIEQQSGIVKKLWESHKTAPTPQAQAAIMEQIRFIQRNLSGGAANAMAGLANSQDRAKMYSEAAAGISAEFIQARMAGDQSAIDAEVQAKILEQQRAETEKALKSAIDSGAISETDAREEITRESIRTGVPIDVEAEIEKRKRAGRVYNEDEIRTAAKKKVMENEDRIRKSIEDERRKTYESEAAAHVEASKGAINGKLADQLKQTVIAQMNITDPADVALAQSIFKVDIDAEGQVKIDQEPWEPGIKGPDGKPILGEDGKDISEEEYTKKVIDMSKRISLATVNFSPRDRIKGNAVREYLGHLKRTFAPGRREYGKEAEKAYGADAMRDINQNELLKGLLGDSEGMPAGD